MPFAVAEADVDEAVERETSPVVGGSVDNRAATAVATELVEEALLAPALGAESMRAELTVEAVVDGGHLLLLEDGLLDQVVGGAQERSPFDNDGGKLPQLHCGIQRRVLMSIVSG